MENNVVTQVSTADRRPIPYVAGRVGSACVSPVVVESHQIVSTIRLGSDVKSFSGAGVRHGHFDPADTGGTGVDA